MKFEKLENKKADVKIELTFEEASIIRKALSFTNFDEIHQRKDCLETDLFDMFCEINMI